MPLILNWTNEDSNALEFFQFDVVTSMTSDDESTVTDHPVEEGVVISDHIRNVPERLSIEGIVTNTPHSGNLVAGLDSYSDQPLTFTVPTRNSGGTKTLHLDVDTPGIQPTVSSLLGAGLGALGKFISGGPTAEMNQPSTQRSTSVTVTVPQPNAPRDRAREAYELLLGAKLAADLVTCDTGMRAYFDMIVERISQPREVGDGGSMRFQVDLRRLRMAETQTVQAPKPLEVRAIKPKALGSQSAKPSDDGKAELASHAYTDGVEAGVITPD